MDDKPYKFDPKNPRLVNNIERPANVYYVSAAVFAASLYAYNRRFFRIDQNVVKFLLFTAASGPASYAWTSFFLSSPVIEAGLINNIKEINP